jgi:trk system potassium uptake protein
MQFRAVLKILGVLLAIFSLSMLTPIPVAIYFHDHIIAPFLICFALTAGTGVLLWLAFYRYNLELRIRDGFLVVILFWTVLGAFSGLPFLLGLHQQFGFTNAIFESISGFTTTGTTVLRNINTLSPALMFYRQQLQFLGGMGIIVLAVAILPMLGVGGMQLYRAETPGPMKEEKITPRITETAKTIWFIYVGLVVLCALAYWAAGMMPFDAIEEAFSTLSTGGFTTHNTSFAFYHSHIIEMIGIFFMFLGGVNFSLHYMAFMRGSVKQYWRDAEFKAYVLIVLVVLVVAVVVLRLYNVYQTTGNDLIESLFSIVSIMTTTGFVSANFAQWPVFLPFLIMMLGLLGACGGSTSGGMKVMRALLLKKQFSRELKRLIHPQGVYPLKIGERVLGSGMMNMVWAFASAYLGVLVISMVLLMATGIPLQDAFGSVAAALGNVGAGIGKFAYNSAGVNIFSKWVLIFDMIAGRLEVFTVLLLFSPAFWRK